MSASSDGESGSSSDDESSEKPDELYVYHVSLDHSDGVARPDYKPTFKGDTYLYHYGSEYLVLIVDKGIPQFHRKDVNVGIEMVSRKSVEESDNLVEDFA